MKKIIGLMMGLGLAVAANADIIAGYDFGTPTAMTNGATTVESGVSASVVSGAGGASAFAGQYTLGDNTGLAASGTTFGSTEAGNFGGTSENLTAGSLAGAITANDYMTFTIIADEAGTLNVSGFSLASTIASLTNNRPAEFFNVLAQANGGSTWGAANALTSDQETTVVQGLSDWDDTFIDLSGNASLQGIDSVEFRIYMWGGNGTAASSRVNFDQIVVEGSVIPEPATIGLLGLGAVALLALRRRVRG